MTIVPIALIPQIMLAGIVAKITSPLVEIISYFTLSRWGNEGFCNAQENVLVEMPQIFPKVDPNSSENETVEMKYVTESSIDQLKKCFHKNYEDTFGSEWAYSLDLDIIAIGTLTFLFFAGVYFALKKKDSMKIK
jgi:hypothetical protein